MIGRMIEERIGRGRTYRQKRRQHKNRVPEFCRVSARWARACVCMRRILTDPGRGSRCSISQFSNEQRRKEKKTWTDFPDLIQPDAFVYCSNNWEEEPKGSMNSVYGSDMVRGESRD